MYVTAKNCDALLALAIASAPAGNCIGHNGTGAAEINFHENLTSSSQHPAVTFTQVLDAIPGHTEQYGTPCRRRDDQ
jgi:hypothetical protein